MHGPYALCYHRSRHHGGLKVAIVLLVIYQDGLKSCYCAVPGPYTVCWYRDTYQGGLKVANGISALYQTILLVIYQDGLKVAMVQCMDLMAYVAIEIHTKVI